jgi:hypothetical protein
VAGVVASALVLLVLVGCGDDRVGVDRFTVSEQGRAHCGALLDHLPDRVAGEARRAVDGSAYAAAWGDPAIVLRCGAPVPASFPGDPCITRNGIGWSVPPHQADDLRLDAVMTLAFREPVLQVVVPAHYRPNGPAEVMADLDAIVRSRTTSTGRQCS